MVPEHVELGAARSTAGSPPSAGRSSRRRPAGHCPGARSARRMVSPLIGESGLIGSMIVANRLTEGTTFDGDDLRLLETLANQAAVALENGQLEQSLAELSRLKEQLRHQAYHDPLTGLANRALFVEQVDAQLGARRPRARCRSSCSSTSTTSRSSTTRWATRPATGCCAAVAERIRELRPRRRPGRPARRRRVRRAARRRRRTSAASLAVADRIIEALQVAVPDRRPGDRRSAAASGSRPRAAARRRGRRAAAQRRRRDVHGQGRRQAPRRGLRADDARGDRRAARAVARSCRGASAAASSPSSTSRSSRSPTGQIVGVEALVRWRHPTRGLVVPGRVHPAGRGERD